MHAPLSCSSTSVRLTPEEQKEWEEKMQKYGYICSISGNIIYLIRQVVNEKITDKTIKDAVLTTCDTVLAGLHEAWSEFNNANEQAKKGIKPDFSYTPPFPPAPPSPSDDPVSWWQLGWNAIKLTLDAIAAHNKKLGEIMPTLDAAGDELVKDLNKYFGSPKGSSPTVSWSNHNTAGPFPQFPKSS